jgi:Zn-dependent membrane protease YugP
MFYHYDLIYWLFAIPGIILGIYAQIRLSATYGKYSDVENQAGLSGAEAARKILDQSGLSYISVQEVPGNLTDHYDPVKKALFLSPENFSGRSISAIGVAAHETGHALQQQAAYALFNFRMMLVPAFQFASYAYMGILFLGYFLGLMKMFIGIVIGIFAVITLFQVITLPVEYDASRRAKQVLLKLGLVQPNESAGVSSVLNAAALTYVAAMLTVVMQFLYLISLSRNDRR